MTSPCNTRFFTQSESESGKPELHIDIADLGDVETRGFQAFDPVIINRIINRIPLLGFILGNIDIPRSGDAIMLASFFRVALQVTEDEPAYARRRQAIAQHYNANIDRWLDLAANPLGHVRQDCGGAYFSFNVQFQPMYNLVRLEPNTAVAGRIREEVLNQQLWSDVANHKNVFFAYIYAAAQPKFEAVKPVVNQHNRQLSLFPAAPRISRPVDVSDLYPASEACENQSRIAIDMNHRTIEDFTWQRQPWQLSSKGERQTIYPGVDYMVAYWLGRYEGFLSDDAPGTCLRWRQRR